VIAGALDGMKDLEIVKRHLKVVADGAEIYNSGGLRNRTTPLKKQVDVDVSGKKTLQLIARSEMKPGGLGSRRLGRCKAKTRCR